MSSILVSFFGPTISSQTSSPIHSTHSQKAVFVVIQFFLILSFFCHIGCHSHPYFQNCTRVQHSYCIHSRHTIPVKNSCFVLHLNPTLLPLHNFSRNERPCFAIQRIFSPFFVFHKERQPLLGAPIWQPLQRPTPTHRSLRQRYECLFQQ